MLSKTFVVKFQDQKLSSFLQTITHTGQLVIGGHAEAVDVASEKCLEAGAKRAVPLVVSGPFHTPLMEEAKVRFAPEMEVAELQEVNALY